MLDCVEVAKVKELEVTYLWDAKDVDLLSLEELEEVYRLSTFDSFRLNTATWCEWRHHIKERLVRSKIVVPDTGYLTRYFQYKVCLNSNEHTGVKYKYVNNLG